MHADKAILPVVEEDEEITNKSGNRPFADVLRVNATRRGVLAGSLGLMATTFLSGRPGVALAGGKSPRIDFAPVTFDMVDVADGKVPVISPDYEFEVLIPWGTPLSRGVQEYDGDPNSRPTADEQTEMVGIGHDGMTYFPMGRNDDDDDDDDFEDDDDGGARSLLGRFRRRRVGNRRGVLAINHEFGRNTHVLGKPLPENLEDVRLSQHAHGVALVEIRKKRSGAWEPVLSKLSRRVTVNTPVAFSGPVAGTKYLENAADNEPQGTVNNCANGETPWGTYLTCEENFNGYFGGEGFMPEEGSAEERYGFSEVGFGYDWWRFDKRFDLREAAYANERNRFGWVVEIDPMDPEKKPVKRTALGRFKHESVAVGVGKGNRIVCYMGDDQTFDYIYKFVSAFDWREMLDEGISPLDEGTLYVARFNDDNSGVWLPLTIDNPALAKKFDNQAELLVNARLAADILGATPMDRPEWAAIAPNKMVYCTLTNNRDRSVADAANPEAPNTDGHIIRWLDSDDMVGETFEWEIFILASQTREEDGVFTDPDGLGIDPDGRVFIQTDGGQPQGLQDQMLVVDSGSDDPVGDVRRLFVGVASDEITGQTMTPDRRTMFINIQHPGNGNPALTNFPAPTDGVTIPRDCTIVLRRKDGGIIGS